MNHDLFGEDSDQIYVGSLHFTTKEDLHRASLAGEMSSSIWELDNLLRKIVKYDFIPPELARDLNEPMLCGGVCVDPTNEQVQEIVGRIRLYLAKKFPYVFEEE